MGQKPIEGSNPSLSARYKQAPLLRGFFVSAEEVGKIQNPVRSTRVRLPGRIAREDVDAGDARRARAMEGPSQSLPETTSPAFYESKLKFPTFIIAIIDIIIGII